MLVEILSRILANEADIARASGGQGSDSPLSLTLASYEHGRMKIAQVKLRPKLSNGVTEYIVGNRMSWEVNNDLIFVAAGISDVAVSVLSNPIIPSTNDTILRMYRDALSSNSGRDMSLDLLTLVGEEIVQLTAEKHPSLVGGPRQTATIADGKVELIPLRFSQEGEKRTIWAPPAFMDSVELRDFDQEDFAELGEMTFFTKVKFVRSSPALDNSFFFDSTFQDCKLYYYGLSSDFILDKSNKLINTTMVVVDEKYLDEPDINKIRATTYLTHISLRVDDWGLWQKIQRKHFGSTLRDGLLWGLSLFFFWEAESE